MSAPQDNLDLTRIVQDSPDGAYTKLALTILFYGSIYARKNGNLEIPKAEVGRSQDFFQGGAQSKCIFTDCHKLFAEV